MQFYYLGKWCQMWALYVKKKGWQPDDRTYHPK